MLSTCGAVTLVGSVPPAEEEIPTVLENMKLRRLIAPLAAAAVTALGVGGVAIAQKSSSPTTPSPAVQGAQSEAAEPAGERQGAERQSTGPEITQAKQAALAKVGSGKVTDVSTEKADPNEAKDAAEPNKAGEPADPAYESKIAYDVEVTKADGSIVDVALDSQFAVLGTENASAQESNDNGSESSSEVAGDDGPGGHADEPANPTANNQASGAQ